MSTQIQKREINNQIQPMSLEKAQIMIQSGFLPNHIKTPQQLLTIVAMGNEQGLSPIESVRRCYTINNKPDVEVAVRWGQVQKARLQNNKKMLCGFVCKGDDKSCTVVLTRQDEDGNKSSIEQTYTIEQATKAGLTGKDNWKKHPSKMLHWRALGNAIDILFADVRTGLHDEYVDQLPEELMETATLSQPEPEAESEPWNQKDTNTNGEHPLITIDQRKRLYTIAKSERNQEGLGLPLPRWTEEQVKDYLLSEGFESSKDIPQGAIYDGICRFFEEHAGHWQEVKDQTKLAV